ncbi:MAG: hypothetical protein JNL01_06790 [Bdellovibrionales bacterium]|nr:hypothetical protein [Bdellovibrionales bacterium]
MQTLVSILVLALASPAFAQKQVQKPLTSMQLKKLFNDVAGRLSQEQRQRFRQLDCQGMGFTLSQVEPDAAARATLTGGLMDDLAFKGDKNRDICAEIRLAQEKVAKAMEEAVVPQNELNQVDVNPEKVAKELEDIKIEVLKEKREPPKWLMDAISLVESRLKSVDTKNKSAYAVRDESFRIALFNLEYQLKAYRGIYKVKKSGDEKEKSHGDDQSQVAGVVVAAKVEAKKDDDKGEKKKNKGKEKKDKGAKKSDAKKDQDAPSGADQVLKAGLFKTSDDLYERVKGLEDAYSHGASDSEFYKTLCKDKWIEADKTILSEIKDFTGILKFNDEKAERAAIFNSIGKWMKGVHEKVENTVQKKGKEEDRYDFAKKEEGVHEFRRDIRGFTYFQRAFPGFFETSSESCPLKGGKYTPGRVNDHGACVLSECLVYDAAHTQGSVWGSYRENNDGKDVYDLAEKIYKNETLLLLSRQLKECGGKTFSDGK